MAELDPGMSTPTPTERAILRGPALGEALRRLRESVPLKGREFIEALADAGGPHLDRALLSRIEKGERGLPAAQWHQLLHAVTGMELSMELTGALAGLLPPPDVIEPLPTRPLASTLQHWFAIAREISGRQAPRLVLTSEIAEAKRGAAAALFLTRYQQTLADVLNRADIAEHPADPAPGDDVRVVDIQPAETEVPPNGPFEIRVRLRNAGTVAWADNRLLVRLGPPITSTIAQTAPLLPVPATAPGDTCEILVPGRGHYLPGRCIVTYVMAFPNGKPCLPGGLSLPVTSVADSHSTLSLSRQLARFLRTQHRS